MKTLFFLLVFLISFSLKAQKLVILYTNDHHGAFMPNDQGDFGLAAQATLVKQIRQKAELEGATVLILSAGDINTGPPESNMFKAAPDIEAMNLIGYDVMVVGNHEFDVTLEELRAQEAQANFDFLAANIKKSDGSEAFKSYVVKEVQGKKVAILGLTTAETPHISPKQNRPGLVWENPLTTQRNQIKKLRKEANLVIALSHLGYIPDEKPGMPFPGDISLARTNPEIDIIIGGHTHTEIQKGIEVGRTTIFQARESGQFLGKIEIDLSGEKPVINSAELISIKNITPDKKVESLLRPYLKKASLILDERVGFLKSEMLAGRNYLKDQSSLRNMLAESERAHVHADIGISDARALRASLKSGEVKMRDLITVYPFKNTLTYVDLDGAELWHFFEMIHKKFISAPDQNIGMSAGFELISDGDVLKEIRLNQNKILRNSKEKIRISMGSFFSETLTEFEFIRKHPTFVNTGKMEIDVLKEFFLEKREIDPISFQYSGHKSIGCNQYFLKVI